MAKVPEYEDLVHLPGYVELRIFSTVGFGLFFNINLIRFKRLELFMYTRVQAGFS